MTRKPATRKRRTRRTSDAREIIHDRFFRGSPEHDKLLEEALIDDHVARSIYDLRTRAGITQTELANRVGTSPSVISRLEDANYRGHSLTMLQRIAAALGKRVEVRFVSSKR